VTGPSPVGAKSFEAVAREWDAIASIRHEQIVSGRDLSYNLVLMPAVRGLCAGVETRRALDIGCGSGVLTKELSFLFESVRGVDVSGRAIEIARSYCADRPNVHFDSCSVEALARDDPRPQFTLVVANMVLMDALDLRAILQAAHALLAPKGCLVATLTHPCYWPDHAGYAGCDWFRYSRDIVVETPFRISLEALPYVTTHVHRPLERYVTSLADAGFLVERVSEPMPDARAEKAYPAPWRYPRFLALRCRRD